MTDEEEKYSGPGIFDDLFGWLFSITLIALGAWWLLWWDHPSGFWKNEIFSYPLICTNQYKDGSCNSKQATWTPIKYRIKIERGEVVSMSKIGIPPKTLTKCNIFDTENWDCPYVYGTQKLFFVDGIQKSYNPNVKYVSQWRYRLAELWELFSEKKQKIKTPRKITLEELEAEKKRRRSNK